MRSEVAPVFKSPPPQTTGILCEADAKASNDRTPPARKPKTPETRCARQRDLIAMYATERQKIVFCGHCPTTRTRSPRGPLKLEAEKVRPRAAIPAVVRFKTAARLPHGGARCYPWSPQSEVATTRSRSELAMQSKDTEGTEAAARHGATRRRRQNARTSQGQRALISWLQLCSSWRIERPTKNAFREGAPTGSRSCAASRRRTRGKCRHRAAARRLPRCRR